MLRRLALCLLLAGCAAEIVRSPAVVAPTVAAARIFVSERPISVTFESGYSGSLPGGAELVEVGSIAPGLVLKPMRSVINVQGAHSHEGYPVVKDGRIVGFYLPAERAYSALSAPVPFPLQERKQP
jgi:hypothetical protein